MNFKAQPYHVNNSVEIRNRVTEKETLWGPEAKYSIQFRFSRVSVTQCYHPHCMFCVTKYHHFCSYFIFVLFFRYRCRNSWDSVRPFRCVAGIYLFISLPCCGMAPFSVVSHILRHRILLRENTHTLRIKWQRKEMHGRRIGRSEAEEKECLAKDLWAVAKASDSCKCECDNMRIFR